MQIAYVPTMSKISFPILLCSCFLFGCGRGPLIFDVAVANDNQSKALSSQVESLRLTSEDGTVIESRGLFGVNEGLNQATDEDDSVPRDSKWQAEAFNENGELLLRGQGEEGENDTVTIPLQAVTTPIGGDL